MAKNSTAPVAVRTAKPKTAAQLAKRDRNVAQAAERLARLQAKQKLVKELRAKGFKGTDDEIIQRFNTEQRHNEAAAYVASVLAVPKAGPIIKRWLKDRINQSPIHVKELIVKFLNRDGSIEGHKDNSHLKAEVELFLTTEEGQKILAHKLAA